MSTHAIHGSPSAPSPMPTAAQSPGAKLSALDRARPAVEQRVRRQQQPDYHSDRRYSRANVTVTLAVTLICPGAVTASGPAGAAALL